MLVWMPKIYNRGALPESKAVHTLHCTRRHREQLEVRTGEREGSVGSWSGRVPGLPTFKYLAVKS